MKQQSKPWHRDGIPAWGWVALVLLRLASLLAALVPLALVAALLWWWTHGGRHAAPGMAKRAGEQARATADSLLGRQP